MLRFIRRGRTAAAQAARQHAAVESDECSVSKAASDSGGEEVTPPQSIHHMAIHFCTAPSVPLLRRARWLSVSLGLLMVQIISAVALIGGLDNDVRICDDNDDCVRGFWCPSADGTMRDPHPKQRCLECRSTAPAWCQEAESTDWVSGISTSNMHDWCNNMDGLGGSSDNEFAEQLSGRTHLLGPVASDPASRPGAKVTPWTDADRAAYLDWALEVKPGVAPTGTTTKLYNGDSNCAYLASLGASSRPALRELATDIAFTRNPPPPAAFPHHPSPKTGSPPRR